jgi:hypothetical protein
MAPSLKNASARHRAAATARRNAAVNARRRAARLNAIKRRRSPPVNMNINSPPRPPLYVYGPRLPFNGRRVRGLGVFAVNNRNRLV